MSVRTWALVPLLLAALFLSPGTRETDAATISSLSLTVTGDREDALFRAEYLVNWNLFTDSPTDTWQIEYAFYGIDTYRVHLLRSGLQDLEPRGPRSVRSLVYANALRWADEDYDYNVFQPNPDEIRLRIRLLRGGRVVYTSWSNQVGGYF